MSLGEAGGQVLAKNRCATATPNQRVETVSAGRCELAKVDDSLAAAPLTLALINGRCNKELDK